MKHYKYILMGSHLIAAIMGGLFVVSWAYLPFGVKTSCSQQQNNISTNRAGDVLAIRHSLCGGLVFSSRDEVLLKSHASTKYEIILSFEHGESEPAVKWLTEKEILVSVLRPGQVYKQLKSLDGIEIKFDVLSSAPY